MKRQFKAGAQAKREVRKLRIAFKQEKKFWVNELNEYGKNWQTFHDTVNKDKNETITKLKTHNIELKAEVMKLEKKCEQLEEQKKYYADELKEFRINESKAAETMIRQSKIMHEQQQLNFDLKFAYDELKRNRNWLVCTVLAYIIVKLIFWIW